MVGGGPERRAWRPAVRRRGSAEKMVTLVLASAVALLRLGSGEALKTGGQYRGTDSWVFLERFSYASGTGNFSFELLFPESVKPQLGIYFLGSNSSVKNEFALWRETYGDSLNCVEKLRRASVVFDLSTSRQVIREMELVGDERMVRASLKGTLESSRPRWAFVAAGSCSIEPCTRNFCVTGLDLSWAFNFTNGEGWTHELGSNEFGLLVISLVFALLYATLVLGYTIRVSMRLSRLRKQHVTVQIAVASTVVAYASVSTNAFALLAFTLSGEPRPIISLMADLALLAADWTMMLLLLLLAKGWTITTRKISAVGRVRLTVFMGVYCSGYAMALIYFRTAVPKEAIVYVYDTNVGAVLIVLRLVAAAWINHSCNVTTRKYVKKRRFYRKFRIAATCWLLVLPVLVLINGAVVEYMRVQLLYGLDVAALFLLQATITALYDPEGPFQDSFPFHSTVTTMMIRSKTRIPEGHKALHATVNLSLFIEYTLRIARAQADDLTSFLGELDTSLDHDADLHGESVVAVAPELPPRPKNNNWIGVNLQAPTK